MEDDVTWKKQLALPLISVFTNKGWGGRVKVKFKLITVSPYEQFGLELHGVAVEGSFVGKTQRDQRE